jgi:hypothetical protein
MILGSRLSNGKKKRKTLNATLGRIVKDKTNAECPLQTYMDLGPLCISV